MGFVLGGATCSLVLFIDRVVRQVRVDILEVACVVLFRCKPDKSFLINVDPQWIDRSDGHVDSEIPLVAIYK